MRAFHVSPQWSRRVLPLAGLASLLCFSDATSGTARASSQELEPFTLVSPDFRDGGPLPASVEFGGPGSAGSGCSGKNQAPELHWFHVPSGTQSFALLVNDMDAPISGGWHHWVVYDIPGNVRELEGHGSNPFSEGSTSYDTHGFPVFGWGGPCPPPDGQIHHYIFTLYALSTPNIAGASLTYEQVLAAIEPSVVGSTVIIGTFRLPLHH